MDYVVRKGGSIEFGYLVLEIMFLIFMNDCFLYSLK